MSTLKILVKALEISECMFDERLVDNIYDIEEMRVRRSSKYCY